MLGLTILFLTALVLIALLGSASIVWFIVRPKRRTFAIALGIGLPTDPADLGLTADEVMFHLPDHATTPGWIIKGQTPDGPTVLILHGHHDGRYGALRFVNELARYAGKLVVFDWPSHGECTAHWMTCGTREPGDALAVLDGLPDEVRQKPVVLFGYSLGGQIAIKTAAMYPERFAAVIADGPYRRWDTPIRQRLIHHGVPFFIFLPLVAAFFHLTGLIRGFDRVGYAKQLQCPLLILHGSDDRVCPIVEGQELADAAPCSTFVTIQGGRHNRLFEHDPATYHAALSSFFKSITEGTEAQRPQSQG